MTQKKNERCMYVRESTKRIFECLLTTRDCVASLDASGASKSREYTQKIAEFCPAYNIGKCKTYKYMAEDILKVNLKSRQSELQAKIGQIEEQLEKGQRRLERHIDRT